MGGPVFNFFPASNLCEDQKMIMKLFHDIYGGYLLWNAAFCFITLDNLCHNLIVRKYLEQALLFSYN